MTFAAKIRQADLRRALKEAQRIGAKRVQVGKDGVIDILLYDGDMADPPNGRHDEPLGPIRIRDRPKKKVVL
jgi:hypothetical protein